MQESTTKWWDKLGLVKQHKLTLRQPSKLSTMSSWKNMDGVLAVLEPQHCWTAYTKMNEKVEVSHIAREEIVADVA